VPEGRNHSFSRRPPPWRLRGEERTNLSSLCSLLRSPFAIPFVASFPWYVFYSLGTGPGGRQGGSLQRAASRGQQMGNLG